jgi:hypothetical protein
MGAGGLDGNWEFLKPVEIVVEVPDLFRRGIYTWAIKRVWFVSPTSQRGPQVPLKGRTDSRSPSTRITNTTCEKKGTTTENTERELVYVGRWTMRAANVRS